MILYFFALIPYIIIVTLNCHKQQKVFRAELKCTLNKYKNDLKYLVFIKSLFSQNLKNH